MYAIYIENIRNDVKLEIHSFLYIFTFRYSRLKGGNLDCTSRVICACCNQILRFLNFGGHFYYSNFLSWKDEKALRFFDFALFYVFFQVLSICHFFNNNLDCTSRVICACCNQILRFFNFGGHFYYSNFSSWSNEGALQS